MGQISKQDFFAIIKGTQEAYPNFKLIQSPEGAEMWYRMLSDIPEDILKSAFYAHICKSKYPPSIADIRDLAIHKGEKADWSYGYSLLNRAIRNFGYYREKEALDWISSNDPIAGAITKRLGWQNFCTSEDIRTDRANFRMAYITASENQQSVDVLPKNLRKDLEIESGSYALQDVLSRFYTQMQEEQLIEAGDDLEAMARKKAENYGAEK